jgi:phosphoribosylformylglycinamidine cyclo-ligase
MPDHNPLTYRDAGVDIDAGDALVDSIRELVKPTQRPEVVGGVGGFGALVRIPERYRRPLLVSGTDGVGTKLRLAIDAKRFDGVGIDLVAMCVNDILVSGAEPLFFLDYYAAGHLDVAQAREVVRGIAEGCRQAGCALVGGETAEMPGMYAKGDFDLAGFCVGVVEEDRVIDGRAVAVGDIVLGLPSSGPHSNGYSLIRRVLESRGHRLEQDLNGLSLADWLLAPTLIYVRAVREMIEHVPVHAMAHITGGGLTENVPRVLQKDQVAQIERTSWEWPGIFRFLQDEGAIDTAEMLRTFNCGIGFVIILAPGDVEAAEIHLASLGHTAIHLGEIIAGEGPAVSYR